MKGRPLIFIALMCPAVFCFYVFAGFNPHSATKTKTSRPVISSRKAKSMAYRFTQSKTKPSPNNSLTMDAAPAAPPSCTNINWATWGSFLGPSAVGKIVNEKGETINVTMSANYYFGSTPSIYNYPAFGNFYTQIPNTTVPRTTWTAGQGGVTTMCFSDTVDNPVLLVASLGDTTVTAHIDFSLPYVLLYDGGGMVYPNNTGMTGTEGYAVVMFPGRFTCVTIYSSTPEIYTNITWGLSPLPYPVDITEGAKGCNSQTLTASAADAVTYQWSDGDSPKSATNTFHKSGTYIVSVTNSVGCVASTSKTITVDGATPPVVTGDTTGCESVTLTASGAVSYLWNGGDRPTQAVNTFRKSGTYILTATDVSGCTNSVSKTAIIGPPKPIITGNVVGCDTVTLTASGGVSYLWDGGTTPTNATNTFTTGGTHQVTVNYANGCTATAPVTVTITPDVTPTISIAADPHGDICFGTPVTFTATVINGGESPAHQWLKNNTPVATGPSYTTTDLANNDTIICRLTSSATCAMPPTVTSNALAMSVSDIPHIKMAKTALITGTDGVQLNPVVTGDVQTYSWSPATGLSDATINNPTANPPQPITYKLTVTSPAGCQDTASVTVSIHRIIIVPNTFTPNGDGVNDTWNIAYLTFYPTATINVYNRWGQPVFTSIGYSKAWDGTYNDKQLPVGTYYYVIDLKDKSFKPIGGWVAIVR